MQVDICPSRILQILITCFFLQFNGMKNKRVFHLNHYNFKSLSDIKKVLLWDCSPYNNLSNGMQVDISCFCTFLIIYVESLTICFAFFFESYGIKNKMLLHLNQYNFLSVSKTKTNVILKLYSIKFSFEWYPILYIFLLYIFNYLHLKFKILYFLQFYGIKNKNLWHWNHSNFWTV